MKEETIERTSAIGSNKEAAITGVKRERNLRLKEWNPAEDDPRTIRSTLRSTLQTKNPHSDPWLLQCTQTHKERTKNREQRERIENKGRPSEHIGPMTIGPPLPNQNHLRISSIGREKREGREEREERIENGESCKNKKLFFFFTIQATMSLYNTSSL